MPYYLRLKTEVKCISSTIEIVFKIFYEVKKRLFHSSVPRILEQKTFKNLNSDSTCTVNIFRSKLCMSKMTFFKLLFAQYDVTFQVYPFAMTDAQSEKKPGKWTVPKVDGPSKVNGPSESRRAGSK